MENRGTLNWSGVNTTYTIPAGYYSGGTIDSRASYQKGYEDGYRKASEESSSNLQNNYHFSKSINDYEMSGFVTMETISQNGKMLFTLKYMSKQNNLKVVDFVKIRIVDQNNQLVNQLVNVGSNNSVETWVTKTYVLNVKAGYKIQMWGQNSNRVGYFYYDVDGYVLY